MWRVVNTLLTGGNRPGWLDVTLLCLLASTLAVAIPAGAEVGKTAGWAPHSFFGAFRADRHVKNGADYFKGASFAGSSACEGCHTQHYADWKATWHAKMEQWATPATVIGDFNDHIIEYADIEVADDKGVKSKVSFKVKAHAKNGEYFFTVMDADNPRNDQTYKIVKTLGGKWDQGYEIKIGEHYFPTLLRYSVLQKGWLVKAFFPEHWVVPDGTPDGRPRRPDELPIARYAEPKCQGCHTTGFEYEKDTKSGKWNSVGNGELGIGCEKCHGPGSKHVAAAESAQRAGKALAPGELFIVHGLKDLDANQQTQLCGQCHGRSTNRSQPDLAFPIGFLPGDTNITEKLVFWSYQGNGNTAQNRYVYRNDWAKRNRQQWQDFTKSTHYEKAGLSCLTCHAFHGKTADMQLRAPPQELCSGCHKESGPALRPQTEMFKGSVMAEAGVTCADCHMARIAYRSSLTAETLRQKHFPTDGSSHVFKVPTPELETAFGVRSACGVCHTDGRDMPKHIEAWAIQRPMTLDGLNTKLKGIQATTRSALIDLQTRIEGVGASLAPVDLVRITRARAHLSFITLDGSLGFHNPRRTAAMLQEARSLIDGLTGATLDIKSGDTPSGPGHWITVAQDDTLWGLAARELKDATKYTVLLEANRSRLKLPQLLRPGMRLWVPTLPTPTGPANAGAAKSGDAKTGKVQKASAPLP